MLRIKIGVVIATVGARSDLLSSRALPSVEKQTRVPDAIVVVRDTGVCNTGDSPLVSPEFMERIHNLIAALQSTSGMENRAESFDPHRD